MSVEATARILQELKDLAQSMVVGSPIVGGRVSSAQKLCLPNELLVVDDVRGGDENAGVAKQQAAVSSSSAFGGDAPHLVGRKHHQKSDTKKSGQKKKALVQNEGASSMPREHHDPNNNQQDDDTTAADALLAKMLAATAPPAPERPGEEAPQPVARPKSRSEPSAVPAALDRSNLSMTTDEQAPQTPLDMDGSMFDGVKTLVLFLNSDTERFEQIARSMWAPEDIEAPVGEDTSEDEEDLACWVRVPSFPFGGGVTDAQERYLFHKYCEVRLGSKNSPNRHHRPSEADTPARITYDAFCNRSYREALVGSELRSWKPDSVADFVVEVEPEVVFDAHSAKTSRRLKLTEEMMANPDKNSVSMSGVVNLRVIMDPLKTGFEEDKEYNIQPGQVVANRFQIVDLLGTATFSRAVRAYDLHQPVHDDTGVLVGYVEVCLKIINNSKEFFDQSLDEIRLLQLINSKSDPDDVHVVRLIDFFYYKEHTFLVTELLSDNLYEYAKFNREHETEFYFTLPRLRSIAHQVLTALAYIHSLNLMHCDLKPENILFVSHRRCIVKVIDFGSSCFLSDHLSSYIQSRSYRAPEVILGADYDGRIDVWSVGAIVAELVTGDVLFSSETVPEMLARIVAICGKPLPRAMLWEGRHTQDFVNKFGCIYEAGNKERDENAEDSYYLYTPTPLEFAPDGSQLPDSQLPYAMLRAKLAACGVTDPLFLDFVEQCLTLDHKARPTAEALLQHPFFAGEGATQPEDDEEEQRFLEEDVTDIEPSEGEGNEQVLDDNDA